MYVERLVDERLKQLGEAEEMCSNYINQLNERIEKEKNRLTEIKNEKEKLEFFLKK
ncbi:hypothetical protein [Cytobacillus firmus]|uniref:hypothetical protein n=1 Tax=Cytobacillus firmus TaxID=1399 RepID=UPI0018CD6EB4|nr:hypothetical protein [Cytobacillus firmus]